MTHRWPEALTGGAAPSPDTGWSFHAQESPSPSSCPGWVCPEEASMAPRVPTHARAQAFRGAHVGGCLAAGLGLGGGGGRQPPTQLSCLPVPPATPESQPLPWPLVKCRCDECQRRGKDESQQEAGGCTVSNGGARGSGLPIPPPAPALLQGPPQPGLLCACLTGTGSWVSPGAVTPPISGQDRGHRARASGAGAAVDSWSLTRPWEGSPHMSPRARPEAAVGGRGAQYLDPVGGVMNDGGLRLLQKREAQRGKEAT